jgi:metal-responsive CopG/Arc/MetJ family transcriptional regulator
MPKLVRVVVRLPSELVERIDAHRGEPFSLADMAASSDRKSGSITLLLPEETIEMLDAFREAVGLKTRRQAIIRLIEDGLNANASARLN